MRKLILAILVISNVSAGIEVATDYEDAWAEFDGSMIAADIQSGLAEGGDGPDEEAACDHCCHGSAHFAGAIFSRLTLPYMRASSGAVLSDTLYQLANRSPPTPPPNA